MFKDLSQITINSTNFEKEEKRIDIFVKKLFLPLYIIIHVWENYLFQVFHFKEIINQVNCTLSTSIIVRHRYVFRESQKHLLYVMDVSEMSEKGLKVL